MADKNVEIGIKATGAQQTAADIQNVGKAVEEVGKKAPKLKEGINDVGNAAKDLGSAGKGDAARSILEFSRAFEDAQYGIRGVLNNIPGLVMAMGGTAGLAGAISIAAVAGSQLWSMLQGKPVEAKKSLEDYQKALDQIKEAYGTIYDQVSNEEERLADVRKRTLDDSLRSISREEKSTIGDAAIEAIKTRALEELTLAREKNRLAEVEKSLITATGEAAIKLSKERADIINGILASELKISAAVRAQELADAKTKVDAADKLLGLRGAANFEENAKLATLQEKQDKLYEQVGKAREERARKMAEEEAKINAGADAAIEAARARSPDPSAVIGQIENRRGNQLQANQEKFSVASIEEKQALAEAAAMQQAIDEAAKRNEEAGNELKKAAAALQDAADNLARVKDKQGFQGATEELGKNQTVLNGIGKDVTSAADQSINLIKKSTPEGGFVDPSKKEALDTINKITSDNVPDSEQAGELKSALTLLANSLTGKDKALALQIDAMIKQVDTMVSRYDQIKQKIDAVQAKIEQSK